MKIVVGTLLLLLSMAASAAKPCMNFDGDSFCLAWASVNGATISNEYVREQESVEGWTRMITTKEYVGTKTIKDFLPGYMSSVKPYMAVKPTLLELNNTKHKEEVILVLILTAPDKSHHEYVIHRVFVNEGGPVHSVIFSFKLPWGEDAPLSDAKKYTDKWIKNLGELEPPSYKAMKE